MLCDIRRLNNLAAYIGVLALVMLSLSVAPVCAAESDQSSVTTQDSLPISNDGPYILRRPDSSYMVLQMCQGRLITRVLPVAETAHIGYACGDSTIEYMVRGESITDSDSVSDVSRIFAVSDIHGEYGHLVTLLRNAGVIDQADHWAWQDGHLVIVGDIFDRGDRVTEALWLLYRLESEAKAAGGNVHVLLGNHELMVLRGDARYIHEKYLRGIEVEAAMPLKELFGPESVLGQWLRTRNSIIRLNGILFVHGGLNPTILQHGATLTALNAAIRRAIDLSPEDLKQDTIAAYLLGTPGPHWYRGYHEAREGKYAMATASQIDSILTFFRADHIVVGHTEVAQVSALYGRRVMALDVPVEELGSLQGLLWNEGEFYRVDGSGRRVEIE